MMATIMMAMQRAAEFRNKEADCAHDFENACDEYKQQWRWKHWRNDARGCSGAEEMEQNSGDEQGKRGDDAKNSLEGSKICKAPPADAEEGSDGEGEQEDGDRIIHKVT